LLHPTNPSESTSRIACAFRDECHSFGIVVFDTCTLRGSYLLPLPPSDKIPVVLNIHKNPDDPVSYACAWLALVPQGLCVVYATLIWSTREVEIMLMFAGQLACEALNFALKRLIKEERPSQMYGKGYGMPSSHAQFVSYFSISLTLFLLLRHIPPKNPIASHTPLNIASRISLSILALVNAALVAWSRIYLNYHTPKQVLIGCAAGTASAILWFMATSFLRSSGLLGWGLDLPLTRLFRVRDLVVEEDLCQSGWEKWEDRRLTRQAIKQNKVKKR
jgi:dolichyldiphosphatase